MKRTILLFIAGSFPVLLFAQQPEAIHLSKGEPLPMLTVFRPKKDPSKGTAIIICAGGAYAGRSDEGEGKKPAKRLAAAGITAFLLDYRLPKGNDTLPLYDARLAMDYIRIHHKELHIDPNKVGIMGFSAGGHLASTAGAHFRNANERPDFLVLAYPVISMADSLTHTWSRAELLGKNITAEKIKYYSNELQVTDQTPGTFITHAMDDPGVSVNGSLLFYAALLQHHVPAQLFLYAQGGHAYDIENHAAKVQWIEPCIEWIKQMKWKKQDEK
jgi:acetyl esterase/lipase